MLSEKTHEIIKKGEIRVRVKRSGMLQFQIFKVKRIPSPVGEYVVLHIDKFVDLSELLRLAEEYKVPFSARNGTIFPKGTSFKDFVLG